MELRIVKRFTKKTSYQYIHQEENILEFRLLRHDRWEPVAILSEADANIIDKLESEEKVNGVWEPWQDRGHFNNIGIQRAANGYALRLCDGTETEVMHGIEYGRFDTHLGAVTHYRIVPVKN